MAESKGLIDQFLDFAEGAVEGVESLSKSTSSLWHIDEVIDNESGQTMWVVTEGHRKIFVYDSELAESIVNLFNREGF